MTSVLAHADIFHIKYVKKVIDGIGSGPLAARDSSATRNMKAVQSIIHCITLKSRCLELDLHQEF